LIKIIGDISEQSNVYNEKVVALNKEIQELKEYIKGSFDRITHENHNISKYLYSV